MKILLTNTFDQRARLTDSQYGVMSLSLLYLAGAVCERHETHILDFIPLFINPGTPAQKELDELFIGKIKEIYPSVVAINCLFSVQILRMAELARLAKMVNPDIVVVVGGTHPTCFSTDIIENIPEVDYVILGEGEQSFGELLVALENGNGNIVKIDGIVQRGADGKACIQPKRNYIENLDTIHRPAYHLLDWSKYRVNTASWHNPKNLPLQPMAPLLTSRSCPFSCNFCLIKTTMGAKSRFRSAQHVLDEIVYLHDNYGVRYFLIQDDNFTTDKRRALDICNGIVKLGLDIQFKINNGVPVNSLTAEMIDALAAAGLIWTAFPIESGSGFIRNKVIGKNLQTDTIREAMGNIRRHPNILINAFFVLGFPEETHETLQETYDMILDLEFDDFTTHIVTPFPGTKVYEQASRDGLLLFEEIGWRHDFSAKELKAGAGGDLGHHGIMLRPYDLSVAELTEWQDRFIALRRQTQSAR